MVLDKISHTLGNKSFIEDSSSSVDLAIAIALTCRRLREDPFIGLCKQKVPPLRVTCWSLAMIEIDLCRSRPVIEEVLSLRSYRRCSSR
jgi:hypothetical protein